MTTTIIYQCTTKDSRATLADAQATYEYAERKLTSDHCTEKEKDTLLDTLYDWLEEKPDTNSPVVLTCRDGYELTFTKTIKNRERS